MQCTRGIVNSNNDKYDMFGDAMRSIKQRLVKLKIEKYTHNHHL